MKEHKFEKDVWFIVKGESPYADLLKEGESITSVNEVVIFEDEASWKSEKSKLGIKSINVYKEPTIKEPKKAKEKSDRGPRQGR
jgi:hypothetical protein